MVGLPVGDGEGVFGLGGGRGGVCFYLFEGWDGIVSKVFEVLEMERLTGMCSVIEDSEWRPQLWERRR